MIVAHIFTNAAVFITLTPGSGRMVADSEITISTTKHRAGTDAAPFLSYLGRLVSLNTPGAVVLKFVDSEIVILLRNAHFRATSSRSGQPSFLPTDSARRRFSLAAC